VEGSEGGGKKPGMTMMDYVIGGMDRSFKLKLFHTLHAAEAGRAVRLA